MPVRIEPDLRELDKAFKRMERAGVDVRPAWRVLRPPFRRDQREHMKKMQGPSGGWAPLARSTVERRMRLGGRAGKFTKKGKLKKRAQRSLNRILSARMIRRAKVKITQRNMTITAEVGGIHQIGGVVGKGAILAKRVFMWVSDPMIRNAARVLAEHLRDAFEQKKL